MPRAPHPIAANILPEGVHFFTRKEAAALLRMSTRTLDRRILDGDIAVIRRPGKGRTATTFISRESLLQAIGDRASGTL